MNIEPLEFHIARGNLGNGNVDDESFVIISARGQDALAPGAKTDLAIKSLSIGDDVSLTKVLARFAPLPRRR